MRPCDWRAITKALKVPHPPTFLMIRQIESMADWNHWIGEPETG